MNARCVLVEPSRDLMLGLFYGHAVHVIDFFAALVVAEAVRVARQHRVVGSSVDLWAGGAEF